jgi:hypothetical protein
VRVGGIPLAQAWDVALLEGFAVVAADNDGLLIFDLAIPSAPVQVASVPVGQATAVHLDGRVAWVGTWSGRLVAVDLTDPALPDWRGEVTLAPHVMGVAVEGPTVAVASWSGNQPTDDSFGLTMVDGADPTEPDLHASLPTPGTALDVALSGDQAWIADGASGLRPVDVSAPSAPALLAAVDLGGEARGVDLLGEGVATAAGEAGLVTVDAAGGLLGSVGGLPGDAEGVAVDGSVAFVACGTGGLAVVDLADPADPVLRFEVEATGEARRVGLSGSMVAVAAGASGVLLFER